MTSRCRSSAAPSTASSAPTARGKTTTIRMLCGLLTPDSGEGTCLGYDIRTRRRQDQAPGRLHDAALLALSGPDGPREPGLRRAALWHARRARRRARHARAARPERPRGTARRRAFRRLEAAPGARRLHAAQPAIAAARRADRRRRPQGAARFLGRDPRARGRRADRAGLHPLHGRGRALPRDRLHRLRPICWRAARSRR